MPAQVESDVLRARGASPVLPASVPWAWLVAVDAIEAGGVIAGKGHIIVATPRFSGGCPSDCSYTSPP
jgi:hypothetical protein